MTTSSCHQLLTVDIDKYTIICPELQASLSCWADYLKAAGRLSHEFGFVVYTQEPLMNPRLSGKQQNAEQNLHCCHIYPGECRKKPCKKTLKVTYDVSSDQTTTNMKNKNGHKPICSMQMVREKRQPEITIMSIKKSQYS